jgi:hypothetical protein
MNFLSRQVRFHCWANQESLKAIEWADGDTSGAAKIAGHIAGISELVAFTD